MGNVAFDRGGEGDISAEAKNLESLQRKNWRESVIRHGPLFRAGGGL